MNDKYKSAHLKISRAKHHIDEFNSLAGKIPVETYRVIVDRESDPRHTRLYLDTKPLDDSFQLILGDAVNNLRSALDHAFAAAIGAQHDLSGQSQFPIRDNEGAVKGALRKLSESGWVISQDVWDVIVNDIQPYDTGHPSLFALNKLANIDKHRLVLAVVGLAGVTFNMRAGTNIMRDCYAGAQAGEKINIVILSSNAQIEGQFKPTISVQFGEGAVASLGGSAVAPTLLRLADDVAIIVGKIEKVAP